MAAPTLLELQAKLVSLRNAMWSGVLRVQHGATSTEFRSLKEMQEAEAALEAAITGFDGLPRAKTLRIYDRSGY